VVLLELLADDRVLVWEDGMRDPHQPAVQLFPSASWRES
jgi:hypothetical protein